MATVFKTFLNNDVATTRTLLNEAIPIDGKIMFGSYFEPPISGETSNIKTFPHEMFQSVYDYPYLKSSANHIFDITLGYASDTLLDTDEVTYPDAAQAKKRALYNQFAQVLVGHDKDGNILKFDEDGNILEGGDKYDEAYLLSVARLLNKDEMKKGSFYLQLDFAVTEPGQRLYTDPGAFTQILVVLQLGPWLKTQPYLSKTLQQKQAAQQDSLSTMLYQMLRQRSQLHQIH
jgi:hypothetical protein